MQIVYAGIALNAPLKTNSFRRPVPGSKYWSGKIVQ